MAVWYCCLSVWMFFRECEKYLGNERRSEWVSVGVSDQSWWETDCRTGWSWQLGIGSRDPGPFFSIPNPGIGNALFQGFRDYGKRTKCLNFTWYLPQKYFFPEFWGPIPGSKAESEQTWPQHQLCNHGGHRSTGAIVLNKLFMHLFTLLYSISLDE